MPTPLSATTSSTYRRPAARSRSPWRPGRRAAARVDEVADHDLEQPRGHLHRRRRDRPHVEVAAALRPARAAIVHDVLRDRAAFETPSASAALPRSSEASSSISSTRRRMLSISISVCATSASRSASTAAAPSSQPAPGCERAACAARARRRRRTAGAPRGSPPIRSRRPAPRRRAPAAVGVGPQVRLEGARSGCGGAARGRGLPVAATRDGVGGRGPMSMAAVPGATPANASRAARLARRRRRRVEDERRHRRGLRIASARRSSRRARRAAPARGAPRDRHRPSRPARRQRQRLLRSRRNRAYAGQGDARGPRTTTRTTRTTVMGLRIRPPAAGSRLLDGSRGRLTASSPRLDHAVPHAATTAP